MSAGERAALAFAGKTEILIACERYERRAISRRNRALRALAKLQRELRREEAIELVGPPRPKLSLTRRIPFREEDVLRLEIEQVMRSSPPMGRVNFSCTYEWQPRKSMVGVRVTTDGDHGFLHLDFQVNGEPIAQTFALAGTAMRVGGVRWTVKCPESGQDGARSLSFPSPQPHAFSFAPCLGPVLPYELSQAERTLSGTCLEAYGSAWRAVG